MTPTDRKPATHTPIDQFELTGTAVGVEPRSNAEWLPAVVPGGVHESLLAAGRIGHPYVDRNEAGVGWIEEQDWWFRAPVELPDDLAPDERMRLVCHGLDTVATLYLDGEELGRHANQHRPYEVDLTDRAPGSHELMIRFSPPLAGLDPSPAATAMYERLGAVFGELAPEESTASGEDGSHPEAAGLFSDTMAKATRRRKAMFSWGWDFGPRVPSVGVWEPVELRREKQAVIEGHHVRAIEVDPAARTATVEVLVEVDAFAEHGALAAIVTLRNPSGLETVATLPLPPTAAGGPDAARHGLGAGRAARAQIAVFDADLWWTHDLGGQPLYDVRIEVSDGDDTLDVIEDRIGLRTIRLDRSPDPEGGRFFRFLLNGVPIFARGAAWLPPSMLVGSTSPERYRDLVGLARAGEMTMLRVWGGGVYEKDAFWAACDEAGVLVWLDFMFACIDYPADEPDLAREVGLEAVHQVRRLRNRASLGLWCGNNEVHMVHEAAYHGVGPGPWGYDFFNDLLPRTVVEHSPGIDYWPGSPYGEDDSLGVNGVNDGDRHAWEVWHGIDFGTGDATTYAGLGEARHFWRYERDRGKFISEFGIHASPELSTLRRWLPEGGLAVHSPSFDHHNKDNPKNKGDALLEVETGLPEGIEQYVDFTMATQAEGLKFGVEHYRRRQPHNSGTLVWQFNDVWPGFSWSVVDHDLVPKAGYYFLKRAYAPVIASFRRADGDQLELWVANSTGHDVRTQAVVELGSFDGSWHRRVTVPVNVPAGAAAWVWEGEPGEATSERYAWVSSPDGAFPANRLFFDHLKNLPLPPPELSVEIASTSATSATVSITAAGFAYFVHVLSPAPGVTFSDNYVDLRAGERTMIDVRGLPADFEPQDLVVESYRGVES